MTDADLIQQIKDDVANNLISRIKSNMKTERKIFEGHARDSWKYIDGNVVSDLVYMYNIEFGRLPGPLPIERLTEWVAYSGKIDHDGTPESIARIAHAVRRKIATEGIEPTRIIKRTLMEFEK